MDAWTDNYRHIPFMTFTLHWISPTETQLRSCTLQTSFLSHPHTADNIVEELKKVLTPFNLNDKIITLVTDGGTNMIKAAKVMKIDRVPCIAHGLHNLVMVDTISKLPDVNSLIAKARGIIKILAFKTHDIEKAKEITQQQDINNILDSAENLEEILEADARFDFTLSKNNNEHPYAQSFPSFVTEFSAGLHKDISTRWNSTLEMLSSLLKNKEVVIRCLEMNRRYDAIPTDNEWKEIEGVAAYTEINVY
ncbi:Transposable element Hobo transposase [Formica fusca]